MNDSQKRREQLLRETRNLYRTSQIPAVHPRYSAANHFLYGEDAKTEGSSSLGARIFISLLLFVIFASADYQGEKIWKLKPSQIVSQIQNQPDFSLNKIFK
ncbi:hypothetical protein ABXS75_11745 [Roseburia hominis]